MGNFGENSGLKKCERCQLPETYETIEFNEQGSCNICAGSDFKNKDVDWPARKKQLDELIRTHRGKYDYDCIIPFSGGKDSTFQLLYLIKEYNIKPLVVRFNHGFMRETINKIVREHSEKLGVDSIDFRPNWRIVKKLMLESFKRKRIFVGTATLEFIHIPFGSR